MATGNFATWSLNFAYHWGFEHDHMATVTLRTKYDPTLPYSYPEYGDRLAHHILQ